MKGYPEIATSKAAPTASPRLQRMAGGLLRALLIVGMICLGGHAAEAKTKKKKTTSSSKASSKKVAKKPAVVNETPLQPEHYPAELAGKIKSYNAQVVDINALRKKDPTLAKARGEVLRIERDSFEIYTNFMSSMKGGEADKIRKTVAAGAWYKGMPQIAFVVSMGLPDDVVNTPGKNGNTLKLIYKGGNYTFEKSRLRSFEKAK